MNSQDKSNAQFDEVVTLCLEIFKKKQLDYGNSWTIFRAVSITDQIYIKAFRIRSIQDTRENKVGDPIDGELKAITNYASMALMIVRGQAKQNMTIEEACKLHEANIAEARALFQKKNHDYGEAWRTIRIRSMIDLILTKLARIKQIEDNEGKTVVSEGTEANYLDIFNYAVFCLIRISEKSDPMD